MIVGDSYRIIELEDILDACDHLKRIMVELNKQVQEGNPMVEGLRDAAQGVIVDTFIVINAAAAGAAICKQQAGLVVIEEDADEEARTAAVEALKELRAQSAPPTAPSVSISK